MKASDSSNTRTTRWWPLWVILGLAVGAIAIVQAQDHLPFQKRNLTSFGIFAGAEIAVLVWWLFFSRLKIRTKLIGIATVFAVLALGKLLFRLKGVSGDLLPEFEPRWHKASTHFPAQPPSLNATGSSVEKTIPHSPIDQLPGNRPDDRFEQFLGPHRDGVLPPLPFNLDGAKSVEIWRREIGPSWSGFAISGSFAVTQAQSGDDEMVIALDTSTGRTLWETRYPAHYASPIAGNGPRASPTIQADRVYTFGSTGILCCLELKTGKLLWTRAVTTDASTSVPEWGFSGSPLVDGNRVIVTAGGKNEKSLIAYRTDTGEILWSHGSAPIGYSSPVIRMISGISQILVLNGRQLSGHRLDSGELLWESPWGIGFPHVAVPQTIDSNHIFISSGYGAGCASISVRTNSEGQWTAETLWKTRSLKAKFANPVVRGDQVYGLDDGIFACANTSDGLLRWKEGRYGHGQGLWVGEHYILMSESGDLIFLQPTVQGPNELSRFHVFSRKTWNPIAIAGGQIFVRNDEEAVCLNLGAAEKRK